MAKNERDKMKGMQKDVITKDYLDDALLDVGKIIQDLANLMNERFNEQDKKFNRIFNQLDGMNNTLEKHEQERLFANQQINRHEKWIHELAKKTKHRLSNP